MIMKCERRDIWLIERLATPSLSTLRCGLNGIKDTIFDGMPI